MKSGASHLEKKKDSRRLVAMDMNPFLAIDDAPGLFDGPLRGGIPYPGGMRNLTTFPFNQHDDSSAQHDGDDGVHDSVLGHSQIFDDVDVMDDELARASDLRDAEYNLDNAHADFIKFSQSRTQNSSCSTISVSSAATHTPPGKCHTKEIDELESIKGNLKDIGKFLHSMIMHIDNTDVLDELGNHLKIAKGMHESLIKVTESLNGDSIPMPAVDPETDHRAKRRRTTTIALPGDSLSDEQLVPLDTYDLRKSDKNDTGYMYVHEITTGSPDARFQAQPYLSGYGKNGRWHAGNWGDAKQAALAVAVATKHLISTDKVKVIMNKIHQRLLSQQGN